MALNAHSIDHCVAITQRHLVAGVANLDHPLAGDAVDARLALIAIKLT